ncbi:MAG: hypothetical protein HQ564_05330 [Candidatus Saganbacteria bacterium]|nr:hypothetical protein [Candidatus Saganbacteria bacterium]
MAPNKICGEKLKSTYETKTYRGSCRNDDSLQDADNVIKDAIVRLINGSLNPKDGDFEGKAGGYEMPKVLEDNIREITGCRLTRGLAWRNQVTISQINLYLMYLVSKARFYKEAKNVGEYKKHLNLAKHIYEIFLKIKKATTRKSPSCTRPLSYKPHVYDSKVIGHAIINKGHRDILVGFTWGFGTQLEKPKKPLAFLWLGYAQLLMLEIKSEDLLPSSMVNRIVSDSEVKTIRNILNGRFKKVKNIIKKAEAEAKNISVSYLKEYRDKVFKQIRLVNRRLDIVKANHLLEIAKRLRVKNRTLALDEVERVIKMKLPLGGADQIGVSAKLTKAWAYSSKANLLEEREAGAGKDDAIKAHERYKALLGTGGKTLQKLAMPRQNIRLSYADNLKLAGEYKEAIKVYETVLKKANKNGSVFVQLVANRAKLGIAGAKIAKVSRDYFETGKSKDAVAGLTQVEGSTRKLLGNLIKVFSGISFNYRPLSHKLYMAEIAKARDTLAWAISTKGRIARQERGAGRRYFAEAKKIYDEIGTNLSLNTQIETGLTKAQIAMRQGDVSRDLKDYTAAIGYYKTVTPDDITYTRSRLSIAQARVELIKRKYTRRGDVSIAELEGIYSKIGALSTSPALTETEKLNAKLLLAQIKGSLGFLNLRGMSRARGKQDFEAAAKIVKGVKEELAKLGDERKEQLMKNISQTNASLQITIADLYKAAGERESKSLTLAFRGYKAAGKMPSLKPMEDDHIYIAKLEIGATRVKQLMSEGNYEGARKVLNIILKPANFQKHQELILDLRKKGLKRLEFKAKSALAFCLGTRGGLAEKMIGEGKGKAWFDRAKEIYRKLEQDQDQSANGKPYFSGELLDNNDLVRESLALTQADLLKAAGVKNMSSLRRAIIKYSRVLKRVKAKLNGIVEKSKIPADQFEKVKHLFVDPNSKKLGFKPKIKEREIDKCDIPKTTKDLLRQGLNKYRHLRFKLVNLRIKATIGIIEALQSRGRIFELEAHGEKKAEKAYSQAAQLGIQLLAALDNTKEVKDISRSAIGLRAIKAVSGALSSLGAVREDYGISNSADVEGLKKMALMLYLRAINGNGKEDEWKAVQEEAKAASLNKSIFASSGLRPIPGLTFEKALSFVSSNRAKRPAVFTNNEVLYATETPKWSLPFAYIGLLSSAHLYGPAITKYEESNRELQKIGSLSLENRKFAAQIHATMGDVFCYRLEKFQRAKIFYERAKEQVKVLKSKIKGVVPAKIRDAERSIHFGMGKIYVAFEKDYGKAELEYNAVLKALGSPEPKWSMKKKKAYALAHMGLGDILAYRRKDFDAAGKEYATARNYMAPLAGTNRSFRIMYAQSYLGEGDLYRLLKKDCQMAVKMYKNGIGYVRGMPKREARKVLTGLYTALAAALSRLGGRENHREAMRYSDLAIKTISQKPKEDD